MASGGVVTVQAIKTGQGQIPFPCERDLEVFAKKIASGIRAPLVIWLEGDLGAAKTTFARALIQALGYGGRVKSPTYGLLEHYNLESLQVLHLDLYRIGDPDELEFLGLEDLMDERTILLIEWPDRGGHWLSEPDFKFQFSYQGEGRELHWLACTQRANEMIPDLFSI